MNDERRDQPQDEPQDRPGQRHYAEPEILPPERPRRDGDRTRGPRMFTDERGTHRIYVTKIGPLGLLSFWLIAGLVSIALLVLFLGAFVILIPVLGLLFVAAVIAGVLRRFPRRPD